MSSYFSARRSVRVRCRGPECRMFMSRLKEAGKVEVIFLSGLAVGPVFSDIRDSLYQFYTWFLYYL